MRIWIDFKYYDMLYVALVRTSSSGSLRIPGSHIDNGRKLTAKQQKVLNPYHFAH